MWECEREKLSISGALHWATLQFAFMSKQLYFYIQINVHFIHFYDVLTIFFNFFPLLCDDYRYSLSLLLLLLLPSLDDAFTLIHLNIIAIALNVKVEKQNFHFWKGSKRIAKRMRYCEHIWIQWWQWKNLWVLFSRALPPFCSAYLPFLCWIRRRHMQLNYMVRHNVCECVCVCV